MKVATMKYFPLISALLFLTSLSLAVAGPANAESGPSCSPFGQTTQDSWAACTDYPNIAVTTDQAGSIGGPGDWYLKLTDQSGLSAACSSDGKYQGNWVEKAGACGQFCYDARIFEIPYAPMTVIYPSITIFSSAGKATFVPTIPATTDAGAHGGWHHICAPVKLTQPGDTSLPSSSDGSWVVSSGGPFNAIITDVNRILLGVDFTAQPSEVVGYDNICMTPGDCGNETIIKSFTKSARRDCEVVTYALRVDVVSNGANPQQVFVSDNWPTGLIPATSVQVSGTPAVTANTTLTAAGWTVDFTTATSTGSVNGSYDITFTSQLDPAFMSSGDFKLLNQASVRVGKDGTPVLSDNPDTSTAADSTIVEVLAADLKACNPPPEDVSCQNGTDEVACGKTPGTYAVTLRPKGAGGVIPDTVQISSLTAGVTVIPAKPAYKVIGGKVKFTVAGANPGDVIKLQVNGVSKGEGSVEGSDLCCNGVVSVTIPEGLDCQPKEPKLAVLKTCDPAVEIAGAILSYEAKCRISVTADGPVSGTLTLTDVLGPSGSSGTTTAVSSADPWSCSPAPPPAVAAGTPIACSMSGADLNAAGNTSTIDVTIGFGALADIAAAKQCARLERNGKPVKESCAPINPPAQKPTLTVSKVCDPAVSSPAVKGSEAKCRVTVTATGTPLPATMTVSDVLNAQGSGHQIVSMTSAEAWTCDPTPVNSGTPAVCSITGPDLAAAGGQSIIDVTVRLAGPAGERIPQQCASAEGLDGSGKPIVTAAQLCVPIKSAVVSPPPAPKCDPATAKLSGGQCRCTVEGMVPVSKTACGCPDGTKLSNGRCQTPPPRCDKDTTVLRKGQCQCRYPNMAQSGALSCQCRKGYDFVRGRGCVAPKPRCTDGTRFNDNRNRCEPVCGKDQAYDRKRNVCIKIKTPPKCDMVTAVPRGDACACRYPRMISNGQSCACPKGEKFQRGRGCVAAEVQCKEGQQFNQRRQRCEPVCGKDEQYDRKRNACMKADGP